MNKLFTSACLVATAYGYASFTATVDGEDKTLYVAVGSNKSSGRDIIMNQNERGTLLTADYMSPETIWTPGLWGSSIEYDWNLS